MQQSEHETFYRLFRAYEIAKLKNEFEADIARAQLLAYMTTLVK